MGMLSGLGAGGGLAVPNTSNGLYTLPLSCSYYCFPSADDSSRLSNPVPPEELYATQLGQLQEMGFFDTAENIRALMATSGNVHAAVERLLGNFGQ
jgi:ubiquilin